MSDGFRKSFEWRKVAFILGAAALSTSAFACSSDSPVDNSRSGVEEDDDESDDDSSDDTGDDDVESDDEPAPKPKPKPKPDAGSDKTPPSEGDDSGADEEPGDKTPPVEAANSQWCKVKPVLQKYCVDCHVSDGVGPMPLETPEDFLGMAPNTKAKSIIDVTKARLHDTGDPMPPQAKLKPEELAAFDEWLAAGAPAGDDEACAGSEQPEAAPTWPPPGCEKMYQITTMKNGAKAKIAPGTETHPQFISDAPWGNEKVQALGFRPITDNKRVLHHWIVYDNKTRAFITGWAPGQDDSDLEKLPEDVAVYVPQGPQSVRLDMHYYNLFDDAKMEEDGSGVEVCVTSKLRKYESTTFMGFAALPNIPPGKHDMVGDCTVRASQPVYLLSESPHAHKLAYHMKFEVLRNGQVIKTLRDEAFNFEEQISTSLPEPLELKTGDVVRTICSFNNDTGRTVTFGEDTSDEMCFNFATYYPKGALSCTGGFGAIVGGLGGLGGR